MNKETLHISNWSVFIPPFIEFVKEHFDYKRHVFLITDGNTGHKLNSDANVFFSKRTLVSRLMHYIRVVIKMNQAKKVILHGLFDPVLILILFFMPWLLKKCYWVMWGGDLYVYQLGERNWIWKLREFFRRPVIRNMGYLVNGTTGDVDLARKWYRAKGQHISCFNYPSNIYKHYDVKTKTHDTVNIQLGNSADPTNQHIEILDQLVRFKEQNIKIFVVLSYGDQDYAKKVITEGKKKFDDKFIAITEMMPFEAYLEFLASIDVAVFNHNRQQAFGNTITLLGLGKKVFLNPASTLNGVFSEFGIQIFNSKKIELTSLDEVTKQANIAKVKYHFSKDSLVKSLQSWIT
uniref:4-alpha-L-fucosyltransferase n=1 Tax=Marinomonas sp. (strain MWYL1) TaxID=400668 RepID=A6VTI0_MARMS